MSSRQLDQNSTSKRSRRETRKRLRDLSAEQAERAIYIDFEGNKDTCPTFLGYEVDGTHRVLLIEEDFALLEKPARGFEESDREYVGSVDAVLSHLCAFAKETGRQIVSFSQHELTMFQEYAADDELLREFGFRDNDTM